MPPHTCFWRHFDANNLPSRFSHGELFEWRRSSFFCCLFEIVDFQGAAILSSVCRSLLSFKAKKWDETWTLTFADDIKLHAKPLPWGPVISSPKPFIDQLWRSTVRLQRSVAKVHITESLLSTTECRKAPKTASKLQAQGRRSGPQRSKKNHQDLGTEGPATSKNTFFFDFGGCLLDRWCSPSLALFPPPFTVI